MTITCNMNDKVCKTRVDNINDWNTKYKALRDTYLEKYRIVLNDQLQGITDNGSNVTAANDAQTALTKQIDSLSNNNASIQNNNNNGSLAQRQTEIQKNNNDIMNQDSNINKLNISLLSKERQIEYTNERNRNRRIMVAVLIIINLVLIFVAYMLYNNK